MKIISWNVNGIRACLNKGFIKSMQEQNPDIICIQETKAKPEQVQLSIPCYKQFWNSADKPGYSGTAVFTKVSPDSITNDMEIEEHDKEGRVITLEFPRYYLVTVYTPNSQRGLTRLDYRLKWDDDFRNHLKKLEKSKPVIFNGDLNVAHKEIDLRNPKTNTQNAGFTIEERNSFSKLLNSGFTDTFRIFNQEPDNYSWWSYMHNARDKNIGWRIDYTCISNDLRHLIKDAFILPNILGSDHCPVGVELKHKI